jgi:rhamnogalacturonan endolyase
MMINVMHDEFSHFAIGPFPYDPKHSAIGEYHYYPSQGYQGDWHDPVVWYGWLGPTWIVTEDKGTKYMEQTRAQAAMNDFWPLSVKGDECWRDYTLEVNIRLLSTYSHAGIVFRYQHGRRYYFFGFEGGKAVLLKRDQEEVVELGSATFDYDCDHSYDFKVECSGAVLRGFVNGKEVLRVEDASYVFGKIGLSSRMPTAYTNVNVAMTEEQHERWIESSKQDGLELARLRSEYAQPRLWKTIDLKNFGTAREVRFGHLTGTDALHVILASTRNEGIRIRMRTSAA